MTTKQLEVLREIAKHRNKFGQARLLGSHSEIALRMSRAVDPLVRQVRKRAAFYELTPDGATALRGIDNEGR